MSYLIDSMGKGKNKGIWKHESGSASLVTAKKRAKDISINYRVKTRVYQEIVKAVYDETGKQTNK